MSVHDRKEKEIVAMEWGGTKYGYMVFGKNIDLTGTAKLEPNTAAIPSSKQNM